MDRPIYVRSRYIVWELPGFEQVHVWPGPVNAVGWDVRKIETHASVVIGMLPFVLSFLKHLIFVLFNVLFLTGFLCDSYSCACKTMCIPKYSSVWSCLSIDPNSVTSPLVINTRELLAWHCSKVLSRHKRCGEKSADCFSINQKYWLPYQVRTQFAKNQTIVRTSSFVKPLGLQTNRRPNQDEIQICLTKPRKWV